MKQRPSHSIRKCQSLTKCSRVRRTCNNIQGKRCHCMEADALQLHFPRMHWRKTRGLFHGLLAIDLDDWGRIVRIHTWIHSSPLPHNEMMRSGKLVLAAVRPSPAPKGSFGYFIKFGSKTLKCNPHPLRSWPARLLRFCWKYRKGN